MNFHILFVGFCLGALARSQLPEQTFLGLMIGFLIINCVLFIYPKALSK